ncbi:MAG: hypothetical protein JW820_00745 [Spirochaetales bacterium]|nr:hypothetical protein [Spirochaetales bacterium]
MRRAALVALLLPLLFGAAGAQELDFEELFNDPNLESLIDQALQMNITAKVLPPGEAAVWNSESRKITLPGRSVAVRLVGQNIRIDVVFTPYQKEDGSLLLVAQGQVWLSEALDQKTRYLTTIQSIPVSWGEKVLFFPLGLSPQLPTEQETFAIQLEVEVQPYKELHQRSLRDPVVD